MVVALVLALGIGVGVAWPKRVLGESKQPATRAAIGSSSAATLRHGDFGRASGRVRVVRIIRVVKGVGGSAMSIGFGADVTDAIVTSGRSSQGVLGIVE